MIELEGFAVIVMLYEAMFLSSSLPFGGISKVIC
jgi:hypothetical protein